MRNLLTLLLAFALTIPLGAQTFQGGVRGRAVDSAGGAIAGAILGRFAPPGQTLWRRQSVGLRPRVRTAGSAGMYGGDVGRRQPQY